MEKLEASFLEKRLIFTQFFNFSTFILQTKKKNTLRKTPIGLESFLFQFDIPKEHIPKIDFLSVIVWCNRKKAVISKYSLLPDP